MNIQQYWSTDLTLLTADFGISLLLALLKYIQYLLYSNCPPPVGMQFSACINRESGRCDVVRMTAYVICRCKNMMVQLCSWTDLSFIHWCLHVAPEIIIKKCKIWQPWWPCNGSTTTKPAVRERFVQALSHVPSVMWGSPIMWEVHLAPYY